MTRSPDTSAGCDERVNSARCQALKSITVAHISIIKKIIEAKEFRVRQAFALTNGSAAGEDEVSHTLRGSPNSRPRSRRQALSHPIQAIPTIAPAYRRKSRQKPLRP